MCKTYSLTLLCGDDMHEFVPFIASEIKTFLIFDIFCDSRLFVATLCFIFLLMGFSFITIQKVSSIIYFP